MKRIAGLIEKIDRMGLHCSPFIVGSPEVKASGKHRARASEAIQQNAALVQGGQ